MLPDSQRFRPSAIAIVAALATAGCSGGGSDSLTPSAVEGLTIAETMSVVTVESQTSGGLVAHGQAGGPPAGSDYATDESRGYVYDPSMRSLQTVNMILCLLKQTAYSGLVNEGLYKAQIDEEACQSGGDGESGTGQSSGDEQQLSVWVVESSRASNSSDQVLEFWIPPYDEGEGDGPTQVRARMTISEGVSDANPFGVFDLNWMDVSVDDGTVRAFGNLHTLDVADGFIGFSFYEEEGDVGLVPGPGEHATRTQANVNMFADQSQGVAHILRAERGDHGGGDSGLIETEFRIAFDDANVLRGQDADAPVCLSRTEFQQNTWRYNLYDAETGARVELNSGFGFQTEDGDYGWAGYHGLWAPEGVEVEHGDVVTRQTYGNADAETYTVFQAPGKLLRQTRNVLALTSLAGVEFEWFNFGPPGHPTAEPFHTFVEYQAPSWVVTRILDPESGSWVELDPPNVLDTELYGFLGMWCPELGGNVSYVHGADSITYFAREVVTPADHVLGEGDLTLYGYFECLRGGVTSNEAEAGDVYFPNATSAAEPHVYRLDVSTMTLHVLDGQDLGPAAGLAEGAHVGAGPFTWGMRTGPLVTSTLSFESTFDIWNADVFYTWETGENAWNRYTALLDVAGDAVVFDPPLEFTYTHSTANDANGSSSHEARTFLLSYSGPGGLHGIPANGQDLDGDGNPDRWLPVFSIADGTHVGPDGRYLVKAIESEYTLQPDPGQCGALDIGAVGGLALPDSSAWTEPDTGSTPEVLDAPRVIEGVVVGGD